MLCVLSSFNSYESRGNIHEMMQIKNPNIVTISTYIKNESWQLYFNIKFLNLTLIKMHLLIFLQLEIGSKALLMIKIHNNHL